jgi:hypothetical protein
MKTSTLDVVVLCLVAALGIVGFTADSNAMLIGLLTDFAEAEHAVGNVAAHDQLLHEAVALRSAMEKRLWASAGGVGRGGDDHFVTAMLDDERSFYDMVDYDANLIAVVRQQNGIALLLSPLTFFSPIFC